PDGAAVRVPVPAAISPGTSSDRSLGDISLPHPFRLTVRLLDADACQLSAAGPLGSLGLSVVLATAASNVHWFDLPEAGEWVLNAECGGIPRNLQPSVVRVTGQTDVAIEARVVKR